MGVDGRLVAARAWCTVERRIAKHARYAVFPQSRRLAIEADGRIAIYDTGEHRIAGISQQQGSSRDLAFISQLGTVRVHDLKPAEASRPESAIDASRTVKAPATRNDPRASWNERGQAVSDLARDDPLGILEQLHALRDKGVLTDEEFLAKKQELLSRI